MGKHTTGKSGNGYRRAAGGWPRHGEEGSFAAGFSRLLGYALKRFLVLLPVVLALGCDTGYSYLFVNDSSYPVSFKIYQNDDIITLNPGSTYESPYDVARGINGLNSFKNNRVDYTVEDHTVTFVDIEPIGIKIFNDTNFDFILNEDNGYLEDQDLLVQKKTEIISKIYTKKPKFSISPEGYTAKLDGQLVADIFYLTIHF
jgi:hypothetical protein